VEKASELSLEGGYLPEASLSTPQESCDVEPVGEKDLGNNLGIPFPNFPEVPEVCDSEAQVVTVVEKARALRCCEAQIAPTPLEQTDATSADESEEVSAPVPAPSLKGRRVSVCAGKYRRAGVGVVECDRSWEVIDVRMLDGSLQAGLTAGTYSLLE
jgi:hypothetical protein